MSGWISLHRTLLCHWMASEPEAIALWVWMLLEANHSSVQKMFNGCLISIERGQLIFGLEAYNKKTNIKINKLRKYLKLFEQEEMIRRQNFNKYSLISIVNYDLHQNAAGKTQAKRSRNAGEAQHYNNDNNGNNENKGQTPLLSEDGETVEQVKPKKPEVPYREIIDLYNQHLPTMQGCMKDTAKIKGNIKARWNDKAAHRSLDFWNGYFEDINRIHSVKYWSGQEPGHPKRRGIELITREDIFYRTVSELIEQNVWA